MVTNSVEIQLIAAETPVYAKPGDAGADLKAAASLVIEPGDRALVPTGVRVAIPEGYALFVMPRSGLAVKHGVTVLNAPGVVDAGYRGEIFVPMINHDKHNAFVIKKGDRIAQMVVMSVTAVKFLSVSQLPSSERGEGGFGSTGV